MQKIIYRLVKETDASEILSIYEPYVKNTAISFEHEMPSLDEFTERIRYISADYPYIICEEDSRVVGYAYAHKQMERAAYQWNAELTVYIDQLHLHCGIGKSLYCALIEILKLQNIRNVYGLVTAQNVNSEKLHEHFGFHKAGILRNTGYKCGAWHDVIWYEKSLGEPSEVPKDFRSIREIEKNKVAIILSMNKN